MSKKLFLLTSFVLVLALANSVFAQGDPNWPAAYWSGFGDGSSWGDANNWYTVDAWYDDVNFATVPCRIWQKAPNSVPDPNTVVMIGQGAPWYEYPAALVGTTIGYPVVNGETAACYGVHVSTGPNDTNGPGRLDVNSGSLTLTVYSDDWLSMMIGFVPDGNGVVNLSGGDIICDNYDGEGGLLAVGGWNYDDDTAGSGVGTLNMTGGEFYCYHMDVPESDTPDPDAKGFINLHGGTFYTTADEDWTEFWLGDVDQFPNSRVDVAGGTAVIQSRDDNELWWINLWIDQGKITAFGNDPNLRAELYVSYDSGAGETTLQAIATEPNQAWNPSPRPGQTIDYRPVLGWTAGDNATQHDVYLGTDRTAVENATTSSPEYKPPRLALGTTSYTPFTDPCLYELGTQYYWRIDEVNAPGVAEWKGLVWDFKTADYLAVEDFDDYSSDTELNAVWDDYWDNETGSAIDLETALVRSGRASMWYQYDSAWKTGPTCIGSIADTDTTRLGISSNWRASGTKALVLYFLGDADNSATADDLLWLQLEDTSSNSGVALYDDMNDLALSRWSEWNIDLGIFDACGVDLAHVDKIHIGFGGPIGGGDCGAGGSGVVYFDDIRLYPSRCVAGHGPSADLTGDCMVGMDELEMVVSDWLASGVDVSASPPPVGPIARYTFDTEGGVEPTVINTGSLGSGANGTMSSSPPPNADVSFVSPGAAHPDACDYDPNYAAEFLGGADGHIAINNDFNSITTGGLTTNTMTLTCWVKRDGTQEDWTGLVYCTRDIDQDWDLSVCHAGLSFGDAADWIEGESVNHFAYHWDNDPNTGAEIGWEWRAPLPIVPDGEWTFGAVAVQRDQATLYMLSGGSMYAATNYVYHVPTTFSDPFNLGRDARGSWGGARTLIGELDDVRIYDYTLSAAEILYVAQESGEVHINLTSPADFDASDHIDFVDYGYIADQWLVETLWP